MPKLHNILAILLLVIVPASAERITASGEKLILSPSNKPFIAWGFNYGNHGRLIEDFWLDEWPTVERDFQEMKAMGANLVRVHLQINKFMDAPDRVNAKSIVQLKRVIKLAETTGIYLDLTGLACYRTADVPPWYDALSESDRWVVQARFWKAIAMAGASSDAIYCYDLMNEPFSPGEHRQPGQWYSGKPFGGYDYIQFITLDRGSRQREQVPKQWIAQLARSIREADPDHLVTVGMLPWVEKWGFLSGFVPQIVAPDLDLISVHIYPERDKVSDALANLKRFAVGKPLVVEETFPLSCSTPELRKFILDSRGISSGWIMHYDGQSIAELESLKEEKTITTAQSIWLDALKLFKEMTPSP